ncbi:hypothetical protein BsWGS_10721 [Bradybaena similaris]
MDIGHLYDDSFFGSLTISLDVKERLQTQEINAREERTFEQWVKIYQRGKDLCKRNIAWQKWQAHRSLHTIWERTPRLEKSLAAEKARIASLEKSILGRSSFATENGISPRHLPPDQLRNSPACPMGDEPRTHGAHRQQARVKENERPLNTDFRLQRYTHKQADFVRRSQHVVRSLARLNRRQLKRRINHEKFKEELFRMSQPMIVRARVVLKGHPELDVNQYLDELENHLLHLEDGPRHRKQLGNHFLQLEDGPTHLKQMDTSTTEEPHNESQTDFLQAKNMATNITGDHYVVLPAILTASSENATENKPRQTNNRDVNKNINTQPTEQDNKLRVSDNADISAARSAPENQSRSRRLIQHTTSGHALLRFENAARASRYTGRQFLLPSLKTPHVSNKQRIDNSSTCIDNSMEVSNISNKNSKHKSGNMDMNSKYVIEKSKSMDPGVRTSKSCVNTTSAMKTRSDVVDEGIKRIRRKNCTRDRDNDSSNTVNADTISINNELHDCSNYNTRCIVDKRNNSRDKYRSIDKGDNWQYVATNYQGGITSDNTARSAAICNNEVTVTVIHSSVPSITVNTNAELNNTADENENETNINTTATARNKRFVNVDNDRTLAMIHTNMDKIRKNSNMNISVNNLIATKSKPDNIFNNIDVIAASHTSSNFTDSNSNTESSNYNRKTYNILKSNNTHMILNNGITSNSHGGISQDSTINSSGTSLLVDTDANSASNNIYNNTTVDSKYSDSNSAQTNKYTNSAHEKIMSADNGGSIYKSPRKDFAPTVTTTKPGSRNVFIDNTHETTNKKATICENLEPEFSSNTDVTHNKQMNTSTHKENSRSGITSAARKGDIFFPSGGVSQVIPEEDEYTC